MPRRAAVPHRVLKLQHRQLHAVVSEALRTADPMQLIAHGAPPDEYSAEVGTILPRLRMCPTVDDVQLAIHDEFVRWFGAELAGSADLYSEAARLVWQAWRSSTGRAPVLSANDPAPSD